MPTPFSHLRCGLDILDAPTLTPPARAVLLAEQPAFLLGNTAADAQTITGRPRAATHFFDFPILPGTPPAERNLFAAHPQLARPRQLTPAHAAFIAGYLAHLALDWLWLVEIYAPIFSRWQTWSTADERNFLHNVLRAYVDEQDRLTLPTDTATRIRAATPAGWLAFLSDTDLARWRNYLAEQIDSGQSRTVEIFAARTRTDPRTFAIMLTSPADMQRHVFARVSLRQVQQAIAAGRQAALAAASRYLEEISN